MSRRQIIIVGAGQAGATVAFGLRRAGFDGAVCVIGDEPHLPYERPQLSKEMLGPDGGEHRFIKPSEAYDSQQIELMLGQRVARVDAGARQVTLNDGRKLAYDHLVIATGVRPRRLPGALREGPHVHYLRTVEDAARLRRDIASAKSVAIVGGGVIGLEVAAAARAAGCRVTVIEARDALMSRSVDDLVSAYLDRAHRASGVDIRYGASVAEYGDDGQLRLSDGNSVPAEAVVVGIGVEPNIEGLEHLGITDEFGIRVDAFGRSAIAGIHATGDVASQPNGHGHCRVETWANAQDHALHLANNLVGEASPYQSPVWFWSDQGTLNLQVVGDACQGTRVVRGDAAGKAFSVFRLDAENRITGCATINSPKDMAVARRWVKQGNQVSPQRLADTSVPLRECAM